MEKKCPRCGYKLRINISPLTPENELVDSKMEIATNENVDIVSNPAHYTMGTIEPKDFIRDQDLNFNRGNVIKYTVRSGRKDKSKEIEDLRKAKQYLEFEIEYLEGQLNGDIKSK